MNYLKTTLISLAIIVLISLLTIKIYYHSDLPKYIGSQRLNGIVDTVEVFTDDFGVPHIFSKNNDDLFFTAGYILARERLFQLSILSAVMNSELSSLLGDEFTEHDEYLQQNDLFSIKETDISNIDDDNLRLIQKYCDGINSYIEELDGNLPLSFKIIKSKPTKWTTNDVINILSLMNNNIAKENREKFILSSVKKYYGESRYFELIQSEFEDVNNYDLNNSNNLKIENEILELLGASGELIGGSSVVLNERLIDTLKPILVFQDVWGLTQPTKWFDMHLKSGDLNVEGAFIPGFPLPLVGRSESSVWSFSNNLFKEEMNQLFDIATDTLENVFTSDINSSILNDNEKIIGENVSTDDIVEIFANNINDEKAEVAKLIANIYLSSKSKNKQTVNSLLNWNGDESSNSSATLLISVIYKNLIKNIFKDELSLIGDDVYETFLKLPEFAEKNLYKILNNSESKWLDNINTSDKIENLSDIIVSSVDEAIEEIRTEYGVSNWQWGDVSKKQYKHILGNRKILNIVNGLNSNKVPAEGSPNNINLNEFDYTNDFNQISGVVIRRIFDMSDMNTSYSILPTGQSGLPNSPHYFDQVELFTNNKFRTIDFDENVIRYSDKYQKLVLYPDR